MKQLILIRHAKSDWGSEGLKDIDRHLNERGYTDAYFMANWYAENQQLPDLIISSAATRALSTALIFARKLGLKMTSIEMQPDIYEAHDDTLLKIVQKIGDSHKRVMLFGHNPGFTDLSNRLAPGTYFDNIPTCGIVAVNFKTDSWKKVNEESGELAYYRFPKDFRERS